MVRTPSSSSSLPSGKLTILRLTATFYAAGLGSCGFFNTDADFIVAVDVATITSFPGAGANPNAYVHLSFSRNSDVARVLLWAIGSHSRFFYPLRARNADPMRDRNPMCGRKMRVSKGSKSVVVTVVDTCPGCAVGSVDLTPAAFKKLAPLSVGRIHGIKWTLL